VVGNDVVIPSAVPQSQQPSDAASTASQSQQPSDAASTASQSQQPSDAGGSASQQSRHFSPDWDLARLMQDDMVQPDSQEQDDHQLDLNTSVSSSTRSSTPSTPSASVAKRRATSSVASSAGAVSRKKARVHAQDALVSVSRSLDIFGERMSTATRDLTDVLRTGNANSSPEHRSRALEVVHRERWLQLPDRIRLGGLVGKGQMADEYMSWHARARRSAKRGFV
jgi:hypothetical protein